MKFRTSDISCFPTGYVPSPTMFQQTWHWMFVTVIIRSRGIPRFNVRCHVCWCFTHPGFEDFWHQSPACVVAKGFGRLWFTRGNSHTTPLSSLWNPRGFVTIILNDFQGWEFERNWDSHRYRNEKTGGSGVLWAICGWSVGDIMEEQENPFFFFWIGRQIGMMFKVGD